MTKGLKDKFTIVRNEIYLNDSDAVEALESIKAHIDGLEWKKIGEEPLHTCTLMLCLVLKNDGTRVIRTRQFKDDSWYDEYGRSTMNCGSEEENVTHYKYSEYPDQE